MEVWKPVVGHEALYEVSSEGRVRSTERVIVTGVATWVAPAKILAQTVGGRALNYKRVMLSSPKRHAYVHHLVAESFIGPRPDGMLVCHSNDDGFDNRRVNIYYGSSEDNQLDRHVKAVAAHCAEAPF